VVAVLEDDLVGLQGRQAQSEGKTEGDVSPDLARDAHCGWLLSGKEFLDRLAPPRRTVRGAGDAVERRLVVAIELLSPSNKRVGGGREEYLERRDNYLNSDVHLIEIDLLRRGTRLPMRGVLPSVPYFAFLSRSGSRPMTGVWPTGLREALPEVPVPLLAGDPDVMLDLQAALSGAYDAFGFDMEIDYGQPPQVPLGADDAAWAAALLAGRGRGG
jgi:hypothetical protein